MKLTLSILFIGSAVVLGCGQRKIVTSEDLVKTTVDDRPNLQAGTPKASLWAWTYDGPKGPANWSSLNPEYKTCSEGQSQSPIDLKWKAPLKRRPLAVSYNPTDASIANTGYTYRLEFTPQSQISFQGQDFLLEKAEIRTPSEHRLSGKKMPIEIQFYHRSPNGLRQAMVSLFAVQGKSSAWFENFITLALQTPPYKTSSPQRMDLRVLVPPQQTFYHYKGSLTHPPCLEGVDWFVLNTPIQVSPQQIAKFKSIYNNNNRPLQPLNNRTVENF